MSNCWRHTLTWLALQAFVHLVALALPSRGADAAGPATGDSQEPLEFRRVLAPADQVEPLARGFLPIKREEFDRLIGAIQSSSAPVRALDARVVQARFQARLEGEQLVQGKASLTVDKPGTSAADLSLSGCQLAIQNPRWNEDNEPPIELGLDEHGRLTARVPGSGTLNFDWSLRGRRDAMGAIVFDVALPHGVWNRLELDLPTHLVPQIEGVVVSESEVPDEANDPGAAGSETSAKWRRWQIDAGGRHAFVMRLTSREAAGADQSLVLLRQTTQYDFSLRGLDVAAEMQLDVHHQPLRQLLLQVDSSLRIVAARSGDTSLAWTVLPTPGRQAKAIALEFSEPLLGTAHMLRLSAVAPLNMDTPRPLPTIRPQGVIWQEGGARLQLPEPLTLRKLTTHDARPTSTQPLAESPHGTVVDLQYDAPSAVVEVVVGRQGNQVELSSGIAVRLTEEVARGQMIAEFRATQGELFTLNADIEEAWFIDRVETTPVDALDDWRQLAEPGRRRLEIRLRDPLTPASPVRLVIDGRRRRLRLGKPIPVGSLQMARFRNLRSKSRLMSIHADEPYVLSASDGAEVAWLRPGDLDVNRARLVPDRPATLLFDLDARAKDLGVVLNRADPKYTAEIEVEAEVTAHWLVETYRIRCVPESSHVQRLVAHLSRPREEPVSWIVNGAEGSGLSARRLSKKQQQQVGIVAGGETWEIELPQPINTPFRIQGQRTSNLSQPNTPALASLPEAASQQGMISVRAPHGVRLFVENQVPLSAIAPPPLSGARFSTMRAAYRYEPMRDAMSDEPALSIVLTEQQEPTPLVWAWRCEVESWIAAGGTTAHTATFHLQNAGASQVRISVPTSAILRRVLIDNAEWPLPYPPYPDATITVPLPEEVRYPTVAVDFDGPTFALRNLECVTVDAPRIDAPVMDRQWLVWLPPGYEPTRRDDALLEEKQPTATDRLLGPFQRAAPASASGLSAWFAAPQSQETSEPASGNATRHPLAPPGWSAHRFEYPGDGLLKVRVYRPATVQLLACVIFICVVAAGWWFASGPAIVLAVGVAAAGALLVPEALSQLGWAGFAGVLLCGLLHMTGMRKAAFAREVRVPPVPARDRPSGLTRSSAVVLLIALAGVGVAGHGAAGQEDTPEPVTQRSGRNVYPVIVPVDRQRRPSGDYDFIPKAFYDLLHRRAAAATGTAREWSIRSAQYRGGFAWSDLEDELEPLPLTATYSLRVFQTDVRVLLPLGRDSVNLVQEQTRLNGRAVEIGWSRDGSVLTLPIAQPGTYQLELSFQPAVHPTGTMNRFELPIPPLATALLELNLPTDAPTVLVPSSRGAVQRDQRRGRLVAQLGPTDRLAVHWPAARGLNDEQAATEVEQLMWLKIKPGTVILDSKWKYKVPSGRLDHVRVLADARLQLLSPSNAPPIARVDSLPGDLQTFRFDVEGPVEDEFQLQLSFLVPQARPTETLRLPRLEALDVPTVKRWLAVSLPASAAAGVRVETEAETLEGSAFQDVWGPAEMAPQLAYALREDESGWSLTAQPVDSVTSADQRTNVYYGTDGAQIAFEAAVKSSGRPLIQHRLITPVDLSVEAVVMVADGVEQEVRWSSDGEGMLNVFFSQPVPGPHRLALRGSVPRAGGRPASLPRIQLQAAETDTNVVRVYRSSLLSVQIDKLRGLERAVDDQAQADRLVPGTGGRMHRLVDTFEVTEPSATASVIVRDVKPRTRGTLVTVFGRDGSAWSASIDCLLQIEKGSLDVIRFNVPSEWGKNLKSNPALRFDLVELPEPGRSRLSIWPHRSVTSDYQLQLQAALSIAAGERTSVPEFIPLGLTKWTHRLVVPTQIESQRIEWETRGLKPIAVPDEYQRPNGAADSQAAYEVFGPRFQAVLTSMRSVPGVPHVRLADLRVKWQRDGTFHGLASFDLEAAGLKACVLELPEGCRLVQVIVDEQSGIGRTTGKGKWHLNLGPAQFPRRIDVVYQGHFPGPDRGRNPTKLRAPVLLDPAGGRMLQVDRTLWTVQAPRAAGAGRWEGAGHAVSALRQELVRVRSMSQMLQGAAEFVTDSATFEIARWYRPWARRLFAAESKILQAQASPETNPVCDPAELQRIDQQQAAIARRLGTTDIRNEIWVAGELPGGPAGLWDALSKQTAPLTRGFVPGAAVFVEILYPRAKSSPWVARAIIAGLILGAAATLYGFRRSPVKLESPRRWPYVWGVLAGLAWWLFLTPGVVGWVIVAVVIAALLSSPWTGRRYRVTCNSAK